MHADAIELRKEQRSCHLDVAADIMLRRLLCSRLVAALPASYADCQAGLAAAQRASFGSASSIQGLPGKAAQPCVSLMELVGTLPRDLRAPGARCVCVSAPARHGEHADVRF